MYLNISALRQAVNFKIIYTIFSFVENMSRYMYIGHISIGHSSATVVPFILLNIFLLLITQQMNLLRH